YPSPISSKHSFNKIKWIKKAFDLKIQLISMTEKLNNKVVVAFVKLKEENLIVDGNGYKKHSWQYGRKYIFFKNKSRLKVHRYKYTFELEPLTTDHEEST
ncbi:13871_t:CDS:2, partial [Dentiscutata heterogama]